MNEKSHWRRFGEGTEGARWQERWAIGDKKKGKVSNGGDGRRVGHCGGNELGDG